MGEVGQVVETDKDKVKVRMKRTEACAKCRACTAGFKQEDMFIVATNLCNAKESDFVVIQLDSVYFFKAAFIMYCIPLITLLLGFFLGHYFADFIGLSEARELVGFFTGIIFCVLTYFLIKVFSKNLKEKEFIPTATEVVRGHKE